MSGAKYAWEKFTAQAMVVFVQSAPYMETVLDALLHVLAWAKEAHQFKRNVNSEEETTIYYLARNELGHFGLAVTH